MESKVRTLALMGECRGKSVRAFKKKVSILVQANITIAGFGNLLLASWL